jgi:hypothetical protein
MEPVAPVEIGFLYDNIIVSMTAAVESSPVVLLDLETVNSKLVIRLPPGDIK